MIAQSRPPRRSWLEFGCRGPLHVRTERFDWARGGRMRLLYASDLHLGHSWTRSLPAQLLDVVARARPDRIVLGGDLADRIEALPLLVKCVRDLRGYAPVHVLPGNHDACIGRERLKDALLEVGATWLPDQPVRDVVEIHGDVASTPGDNAVLCTHHPNVFPRAAEAGFRLVLAGHLHGGQCVFFTRRDRLYPAAWIDGWHGLRFEQEGAVMLVSRGAADTLPLRWNCPRETLMCDFVDPTLTPAARTVP
jgi:predicted MPP superfamily phosphohydrolase